MARLAGSLVVLRDEIDARAPSRSKVSDGWIGDAAHAATASDHNPNAAGVVCALDVTHDPAGGCDGDWLFGTLIARRHPDFKYGIWNHGIVRAYDKPGIPAWSVAPYSGDPHTSHVHVSVGVGSDGRSQPPYDDPVGWLNQQGEPTMADGRDSALFVVKGDASDEWWLTDWLVRRHLLDVDPEVNTIRFITAAAGVAVHDNRDSAGNPIVVPQAVIDAIPRIDVTAPVAGGGGGVDVTAVQRVVHDELSKLRLNLAI